MNYLTLRINHNQILINNNKPTLNMFLVSPNFFSKVIIICYPN